MDFPVWDARTSLPVNAPARCGVQGEDEGRPELVSVSIWRCDQTGRAVHTTSFRPPASPRDMAADVALALAEPLSRLQGGELRDVTREVVSGALHREARSSTLIVDGQPVPATRFEFTGGLTVEASNDPSACVAVAALGVPIPALVTAAADTWQTAAAEAVNA
ncbi:hypothetical protein [Catellatospora chokoriensis]|uniref:Uncharacterized protein n=1 Tax=Catellatospora chokoriensis TaxID=310353 RepID=A0A8J3NTQ7_9ACTN|nr:hypothetical protein [Catellatospora chokoriensis]GIF92245.1 hypothetical protein Cch02nite_56890 [Catellatospora chokoriensis]